MQALLLAALHQSCPEAQLHGSAFTFSFLPCSLSSAFLDSGSSALLGWQIARRGVAWHGVLVVGAPSRPDVASAVVEAQEPVLLGGLQTSPAARPLSL